MSRSFFAAVLASARRFTSSLPRMWLTWVFTVGSFTSMICAISALDLSAQRRWRICSSVGVSSSPGSKAGFEEMRVERRLRPHRCHQPLAPCFVAVPVQRFQQRQHRRAVYADGADESVLRRRVQRRRQSLAPPLILLRRRAMAVRHSGECRR